MLDETPFSAKYISAPGLPAVYISPRDTSCRPNPPALTQLLPPAYTHAKIFARDSLYIFSHETLFCVFSFLSRFYSRFSVWYLTSGGDCVISGAITIFVSFLDLLFWHLLLVNIYNFSVYYFLCQF